MRAQRPFMSVRPRLPIGGAFPPRRMISRVTRSNRAVVLNLTKFACRWAPDTVSRTPPVSGRVRLTGERYLHVGVRCDALFIATKCAPPLGRSASTPCARDPMRRGNRVVPSPYRPRWQDRWPGETRPTPRRSALSDRFGRAARWRHPRAFVLARDRRRYPRRLRWSFRWALRRPVASSLAG